MSAVLRGGGFLIRRANAADVPFLVDLAAHAEIEPFMAAVSPRNGEELG
jgi:hypothetical protein